MTEETPVSKVEKLECLVEDWREKPRLYNPKFTTDAVEWDTKKLCADQLERVIENEFKED